MSWGLRIAVCALVLGVVAAAAPAAAQPWEFNTSSAEGWGVGQSVANLRTSGGCLVGDVSGHDPFIIGPRYPDINAGSNRYIQVRMKTNAGNRAQFFWGTSAEPYHRPGREIAFAISADNQFRDYYIDMAAHPQWTGLVNTLRLDPSDVATGHFEIDYIRVVPAAPAVLSLTIPSAENRFAFVGEQFAVTVGIRNDGHSTATGIQATLTAPGQTILTPQPVNLASIAPGEEHSLQWTLRADSVRAGSMLAGITSSSPALSMQKSSLLVVTVPRPTSPEGAPDEAQAYKDGGGNAIIENSKVRLACLNSPFGCGVGEFYVRRNDQWELVGASSPLSRVTYRRTDGNNITVALVPTLATPSSISGGARLRLNYACSDSDGGVWQGSMTYDLLSGGDLIKARFTLSCTAKRDLAAWAGPGLCAGNRGFGSAKTQAMFPGLEWLAGSEKSSNTLECAPGFNTRVAPHPYKVTVPLMAVSGDGKLAALLWDPLQKWDGVNPCPSAAFASPNWFERQENHLMELLVPSVPGWVSENSTVAFKPYALAAGASLALEAWYLARAEGEPLDAVDEWYSLFEVPAMPGGAAMLESGLATARVGLMSTLWNPTAKGWPEAVGWEALPCPELAQDLFADSLGEPDAGAKAAMRARVDEAVQKAMALWGAVGLGSGRGSHIPDYRLPYFVGYLEELAARMAGDMQSLVSSQQADGGWLVPVNPDHPDLTTPGAKELGSCAKNACRLLRHARLTGSASSTDAGLRALGFMNGFTIPRAAQVWEVPQHAPDLLAAAWACGAYLEGYLLSGEQAYLEKARYWARAGLPFVYTWRAPDRSVMDYGSIPVFGCTFFTIPWFGLPVQWCGMVHAHFISRLAEHDDSMPWRTIAEGIVRSGIQQMNASPYPGAYPDSMEILYGSIPNPVYINPDTIYKCASALLGRWGEVRVRVVPHPARTARVSTGAKILLSCFNGAGTQLLVKTLYPASETRYMMVCGFGLPAAVYKGQAALSKVADVDAVSEGWSYNASLDSIVIKAAHGASEMEFSILSGGSLQIPVAASGPHEAKALPDSALVDLAGVIVAGTGEFADAIYVESEDRVCGIRVIQASEPRAKLRIGDRVRVMGSLCTEAGERCISGADAQAME